MAPQKNKTKTGIGRFQAMSNVVAGTQTVPYSTLEALYTTHRTNRRWSPTDPGHRVQSRFYRLSGINCGSIPKEVTNSARKLHARSSVLKKANARLLGFFFTKTNSQFPLILTVYFKSLLLWNETNIAADNSIASKTCSCIFYEENNETI